MAALLAGVADACQHKNIRVPQKIKDISRVLKGAIGRYIESERANETPDTQKGVQEEKSNLQKMIPEETPDTQKGVQEEKSNPQNPEDEGYSPPWDYVLKKQERLSDIAKRTGFDVDDIVTANDSIKGLLPTSMLVSGTELMYPRYVEYATVPDVREKEFVIYNEKLEETRTAVVEIAMMHRGELVDVVVKMFSGDRYAIEKELDLTQLGYAVQKDITLYYTGKHHAFTNSILQSIYDEYFGSGTVGVIIMTALNTLAHALHKYRHVRYGRYSKTGALKQVQPGSAADWKRNTWNVIRKLHTVGIVHGDLKYGNVLINESTDDDLGRVYIIDFERSFKKQDASFQDEWNALPHASALERQRRNKTCLRDMRDLFGEQLEPAAAAIEPAAAIKPAAAGEDVQESSFTFANGVLTIREDVSAHQFKDRRDITALYVEKGVTKIANNAFYKCAALTKVTLPDTLTDVGEFAFYKCTALSSLNFPDSVKHIGQFAFFNCIALTTVTLPGMLTDIYEFTFSECTRLTAVTIKEGVEHIDNYAFTGCTALRTVTLPSSLTKIGRSAFGDCRVRTVKIPHDMDTSAVVGWTFRHGVTIERQSDEMNPNV